MMKYFFTYIVECADKSYYVGFTNDIKRRIDEHNEGRYLQAYTFSRRPVRLVYYEKFLLAEYALKFEKQIKGWTRKKKEALIAENWDKLKELAECKNKTSHKNYKRES